MPVTVIGPSNRLRRGDQSGQMLVSVIVLLTLMFFIGSAMALAVSSSLHTIAQTNNVDAGAYAAESAVAQGFARTAAPVYQAPTVTPVANGAPLAPAIGCNSFKSGGGGGDAGDRGGNRGNRGNISAAYVALAASGTTTWSYAYEVVADDGVGRYLVGRSAVGTDNQGPNALTSSSYETIFIPHISVASIAGAQSISFEVYRTAASGDPFTTGCIGVFAQQPLGTTVNDTGPVSPAPPMCTSPSAPPLFSQVNNYGPGGTQGPLTASTCRVPMAPEPNALQMWSASRQPIGACVRQTLRPAFSPGNRPGTIWGVIGWHSTTSKQADLAVSMSSCANDPKCYTSRAIAPGVLYYWCQPGANSRTNTLYIVNAGGNANLTAFVVRAAPSGTDCVATTIGQAGPVVDEIAQQMPGCAWTNSKQNLWSRVLP